MDNTIFGHRSFCILDIETTGFSPQYHEITEISALLVNEQYQIVNRISRLIRISSKIPWKITEITGITDSILAKNGTSLVAALHEINSLLNENPVFAHKAIFDQRFINAATQTESLDFQINLACSIPIFKRLLPGMPKYNLQSVATRLGVNYQGAHRGLADCEILLECLKNAHGHLQDS